jgi:ABC-2 type transport system permease protein
MLWYKAWIETRARFLCALFGITLVISVILHHYEVVINPSVIYNNRFISFIDIYVMGLWLLSVVLFAMGGLMREKAVGASSFTLALPVSRTHLLGIRITVGVVQAILAAVFPWLAILVISDHAGKPFPISQAALYLLLLLSGGFVYFSLAVLISTVIEGEYTAPAVAYGLTILTVILFGNGSFADPYLNIGKFMTGGFLFSTRTYLLRPGIPWPGLIACWSAAALMLFASIQVTNRREF